MPLYSNCSTIHFNGTQSLSHGDSHLRTRPALLPLGMLSSFSLASATAAARRLPRSRLSRYVSGLPLKFDPKPRRVRLHIPSRKLVTVSAICDPVPARDEQLSGNRAKKVIGTAVSVVLAIGLASLIHLAPAIASTPVALPTGGSAATTSNARVLLVSAWMGLMAGCLHTLTGPDHLAALAPLSIGRSKLESVAVGALWGCGHDAGQVLFGILFLLLKDKLHIEILRTWGARVVAMTLMTIGFLGIKEAQELPVPCLNGSSGTLTTAMPLSESFQGTKKKLGIATFATGIVHGLQPDALLVILPAVALPSRFAGAAFLLMFLLGTVLAMSGYTAFIGSCSTALKGKIPRITEHLSWASSLVAIFVGAAMLVSELFGFTIF